MTNILNLKDEARKNDIHNVTTLLRSKSPEITSEDVEVMKNFAGIMTRTFPDNDARIGDDDFRLLKKVTEKVVKSLQRRMPSAEADSIVVALKELLPRLTVSDVEAFSREIRVLTDSYIESSKTKVDIKAVKNETQILAGIKSTKQVALEAEEEAKKNRVTYYIEASDLEVNALKDLVTKIQSELNLRSEVAAEQAAKERREREFLESAQKAAEDLAQRIAIETLTEKPDSELAAHLETVRQDQIILTPADVLVEEASQAGILDTGKAETFNIQVSYGPKSFDTETHPTIAERKADAIIEEIKTLAGPKAGTPVPPENVEKIVALEAELGELLSVSPKQNEFETTLSQQISELVDKVDLLAEDHKKRYYELDNAVRSLESIRQPVQFDINLVKMVADLRIELLNEIRQVSANAAYSRTDLGR